LVDIPPELPAGESNITNAGADEDEGGMVKELDEIQITHQESRSDELIAYSPWTAAEIRISTAPSDNAPEKQKERRPSETSYRKA
jgi:hypothetical protein